MSGASIARWKTIPMERTSQLSTPPRNLKRPRSPNDSEDEESDGGDGDNVSLVSRSPSPKAPLDSAMQKVYSEHVRGIDEEIVTLETKIRNTNIGYAMLQKLGWKDGEGLGARSQGRPDPVSFEVKNDSLGLGKASLDRTVIEATVSQRRDLDSERLLRETEEQRRAREDKVAKEAAIKTEVTAVLKPFYCDLCDKQYQRVAQYDEHCNSYAHHHKVREKDLRAAARVGKDSASVRQEKERKREEKELKKIAKVHGIKLTTPSQTAPLTAAATAAVGGWSSTGFSNLAPAAPIAPVTTSSASKTFKSGGWATVGSVSSLPPATNPPAESGGWTTVESASASSGPLSANPPPPNEPAPPPPPPPSTSKAPAFRSSGWTQMDHLTDVKTIVDTEPPPVDNHPYTSMDYEMDHTEPPPPPADLAPPPPADLPPPLPTNDHRPGVAATPRWRTHFAPSPSPSAFGPRGAQSDRDHSPVRSTGFGGDAPWTNDISSPSAPRKPSRWDRDRR